MVTRDRRHIRSSVVTLALVAATVLPPATPAIAATPDVCPAGCAFTSIQAAIDAAASGATISVGAGTYVEDLTISKQLTIAGPNAGRSAGPTADLGARLPEAIVQGSTSAGARVSATGVVIDGLTFLRPSSADAAADARLVSGMAAGIHITIRNSIFDLSVAGPAVGCGSAISNGDGGADKGPIRFTIERNRFAWHQYKSGTCTNLYASRIIYLDSGAAGTVIDGNSFFNVDHLYATTTAHGLRITRNRFEGRQPIVLGAIQDPVIQGNTFTGITGNGMYLEGTIRARITDNLFADIGTTTPYIYASGTTDLSIVGNTFDRATYSNVAYWSILVGYPSAATGTTVANNLFTANTAAAFWNCTATGTVFTRNHVASAGKLISGVLYAARNGSATACTGKALDATGNYWSTALDFQTTAPATTTRTPDLASFTPSPVSPGFWPLPPAEPTITETLAPTADAPKIVAQFDAPVGSPDISLAIDFGAISESGEVTVTASEATTDGSISFGGNPIIDISFDGTFTPPVEICLSYTDATFPPGTTPALWHYGGAPPAWSQLETSKLDSVNRIVCGLASSFSGFGVGVANGRPTVSSVSATPGSQTYGGDVVVTAVASDTDGTVATVEYSLDDGATWTAMTFSSGSTYTATITRPAPGSYTVVVRAKDDLNALSTGNPTDTFEILRPKDSAPLLFYAGDSATTDGQAELAAVILPARCEGSITFDVSPDPVGGDPDPVEVDAGAASTTITLPGPGLYEVLATWDGTGSDCVDEEVTDRASLVSFVPGGTGSGSGSYAVTSPTTGPTRATFDFTVSKVTSGRGRSAIWTGYAGRFTWLVERGWRISSLIGGGRNVFGTFPCPADVTGTAGKARCAAFIGAGTLQAWVPDLNGPRAGGWVDVEPVSFTVMVVDGNAGDRCQVRRPCVSASDWFGIEIDRWEAAAIPQTAPLRLARPDAQGSITLKL